jgi:hypothetical protein
MIEQEPGLLNNFGGKFLTAWLLVWPLFAVITPAQSTSGSPSAPSTAAIASFAEHDFDDFHEDWKSIKLDTSTLELKEALIGERLVFPSFTREFTRVKWRPTDPIDLNIAIPKGVEKPPVIIYMYGFPTDLKRYGDESWYGRITGGGFAAVAFIPSLEGSRFHAPRPMNQTYLSQLPEAIATLTHDVQMLINYLSSRKDLNLDLSHIGIFATGSGATAAILAAAADPRITAIDLLNPWGDWPDWLPKSELVGMAGCDVCTKPEFLPPLAPLDPVKWLPTLKTPYVRIRHFVENGQTPRLAQDKMEAVVPKTADVTRFDSVVEFNRSATGGRTFDWIKGALKFDSQVPPATTATQKPLAQESPH